MYKMVGETYTHKTNEELDFKPLGYHTVIKYKFFVFKLTITYTNTAQVS